MEQLNLLTKNLNTLRQLSRKIISRALPIMKELETSDNDLVDEFLEAAGTDPKLNTVDKETAIALLQDVSLELIVDAETVNREIENFSEAVVHGEDGLTEGEDEYPFLLQVWYGDMYGDTGIEGLQTLVSELREQLLKINEDHILEEALSRVQKNEEV